MEQWTNYKELYLQNCRAGRRLSINSLKAYTIDLDQFFSWIASQNDTRLMEPEALTKSHLQEYFYSLRDKYAAKTAKRKLACLRGFFSF